MGNDETQLAGPLTRDEIYANAAFASKRFDFWSILDDGGFSAIDSELDDIEHIFERCDDLDSFARELYDFTEGKVSPETAPLLWAFLKDS